MRGVERQRGRVAIVFAILGAVIVLLGAGTAGVFLYGRQQLSAPADSHGAPVAVEVNKGEGVDGLATDLEARGLIRSSFWFTQYARYRGLAGNLRAGRFMIDSGMSSGTVIAVLEGDATPAQTKRVSLAEGLTAEQMGHAIAGANVGISQADYILEVHKGKFKAPFLSDVPAGFSLEGFLFPDTYEIPEHATAHDVVQLQLDNFGRHLAALKTDTSTVFPIVITASILEREAKSDTDRPLVASVIQNRLAKNMNLQVDATVLYGLHLLGRDGNTVDTHIDTPFNSYLHPGLPPAPISNPGAKSLEAAARPAHTDYLYYVSDGCGNNHYAVTDAAFLKIKNQYVDRPCPGGSPSPS